MPSKGVLVAMYHQNSEEEKKTTSHQKRKKRCKIARAGSRTKKIS
jgi:hypothetical protein